MAVMMFERDRAASVRPDVDGAADPVAGGFAGSQPAPRTPHIDRFA